MLILKVDAKPQINLMERLMTTFEKINDVLVHLFQEIWELEEKAIITEEFKDITIQNANFQIKLSK